MGCLNRKSKENYFKVKFYFISPIGQKSYLLFDTFEDTFKALGHEIVSDIDIADVVFYDLWCGYGEYFHHEISETQRWKKPVIVFDFHDYYSNEKILHKWPGRNNWEAVKHQPWAEYLRVFIDNDQVKVYFMRKMTFREKFPDWVHPIDCCTYPDHDFGVALKSDFFDRKHDITFIGAPSTWRANAVSDLMKGDEYWAADMNKFFTFERLSHAEWLKEHGRAKMYLTGTGGGFSDERSHQLYSVSACLRLRSDHLLPYPFTDMFNCVEVGDMWGQISDSDFYKLKGLLYENEDKLYDIYVNGYNFMKEYYSPESRAKYILTTILNNL